jgi:hypothetical protein
MASERSSGAPMARKLAAHRCPLASIGGVMALCAKLQVFGLYPDLAGFSMKLRPALKTSPLFLYSKIIIDPQDRI